MAISIEQAVLAINPNAAFSCSPADNQYEHIVWRNGTTPISKEDVEAKMVELEEAKTNAEAQKAIDKASGNQKLLDLGLSQAEVDALTK
tara:strand:- start:44 stop:310 length:267 start_codon:yes stop_codon:yes gene_type:complete